MDGAAGRAVTSREEGIHLVVGPVDRTGLLGLLLALATQLEGGFHERLRFRLLKLGIHQSTILRNGVSRGNDGSKKPHRRAGD